MASDTQTFNPAYGTGVTVAPGTTSASVAISGDGPVIVVTNLSSYIVAYVRTGIDSATATTADYPVLPGTQVSLSKGRYENRLAYITASGTSSLHIISGRGM